MSAAVILPASNRGKKEREWARPAAICHTPAVCQALALLLMKCLKVTGVTRYQDKETEAFEGRAKRLRSRSCDSSSFI